MQKIFEELNFGGNGGWDWRISAYDGWTLELSAGTSIEYARPVLRIQGVSYLNCPFEFSHPIFRDATAAEWTGIAALVPLDQEDHVVAIDAETIAATLPSTFFIVGESWILSGKV